MWQQLASKSPLLTKSCRMELAIVASWMSLCSENSPLSLHSAHETVLEEKIWKEKIWRRRYGILFGQNKHAAELTLNVLEAMKYCMCLALFGCTLKSKSSRLNGNNRQPGLYPGPKRDATGKS